jgi:hypothetical protein
VQQIQEVKMKKLVFALSLTVFMAVGASAFEADVAPIAGTPNLGDGTFPVLATIDVETTVGGDYQCVGVGYDGTNFWVSAGDGFTGVCNFYIFDEYGNWLDTIPQGGGATGWGHRDLCWNGEYMFGSYSSLVDAFGPDYQYAGYFVGCQNPNRCQAFDGDTYYTGNFSENLTSMDWDGVFGSVATCTFHGPGYASYGLAYDYIDDVLWMSTADYSGSLYLCTTDFFVLDVYSTLPETDIHGGCTMACTAQYGYVLVILSQAAPDTLFFYDVGHGPSAANDGSWGSIKAMYR